MYKTQNQHRRKSRFLAATMGCILMLTSLAGFSADTKPDLDLGGVQLSAEEQTILQEQGFIVRPAGYETFYELYQEVATSGRPILVTTDAIIDVTNTVLDHMILAVELQLQPKLCALTQYLADASKAQWTSSSSDELKELALKNWAYFTIAQHLLGSTDDVPNQIASWVKNELELIQAHAGPAKSPLFGYYEDYSAYDFQGNSSILLGYRQAMTWYERMIFRLRPGNTEEALVEGNLETIQALLVTHALNQSPEALKKWRQIYKVSSRLSSERNNPGVEDYLALMDQVYGSLSSIEVLTKDSTLEEFIKKALDLKQALMIPAWLALEPSVPEKSEAWAPGFSLMGWRFSPDAYIFQELISPNVGTSDRMRELPNGLDLMAVYGSSAAETLLEHSGAYTFRHYETRLERLQDELPNSESTSLLARWLNVLSPLLKSPIATETLPAMGSEEWQYKTLQTGLAAWLQRRHQLAFHNPSESASRQDDTAQVPSYAYVEPSPELYADLSSLAEGFAHELAVLGIDIPESLLEQLANLKELLEQLENTAVQELAGEELQQENMELIQTIGQTLEELSRVPPRLAEALGLHKNCNAELSPTLIDLHTNYRNRQVLQGGLGHVFTILALVEGEEREWLVQGGVFSYYEFAQPIAEPITEEAWEERLAQGDAFLPWWTEGYAIQPYEQVSFDTLDSGTLSAVSRPLEMVIRDEEAWASLWKEHTSVISPAPPLPQIDFNKTMIVVIYLGEQFTAGYTVRVTDVKQLAGELRLYYTIEYPAPECFVAQALTQPFEIIKLPYSEQAVSFVPHYQEAPCQQN